MKASRRRFLKAALLSTGATAGLGAWWLGTSRRRSARWLRQMMAEARRPIQAAPMKPDPATWDDNAVTLCWLGHATVLINFYGVKVLIDPAFSRRIGIDVGIGTAGPKRYVASPLGMAQLPSLDLILLSHAHMDHMDLPSLARLPKNTATITAAKTADILQDSGLLKIQEMRWDDQQRVVGERGELLVEAIEVKHWGKRYLSEKIDRGYNGYILRREGRALLVGGDTADTPLFRAVRPRGPFEAAVMPIGAYNPWIRSHCTPEQAFEMADAAGAKYLVPAHHQTFRLSDEPMSEPLERLQKAAAREPDRIALTQIGGTFVSPLR